MKMQSTNEKTNTWAKVKRFALKNYAGYVCTLPVILSICLFTLYPLISSLIYSFNEYDIFRPMRGVGFANYKRAFTSDWVTVSKSIKVTLTYMLIVMPSSMILSFSLSLALNSKMKGTGVYKILVYLPCLAPVVVSGIIWQSVTNVRYGLGNEIITAFGLKPSNFFTSAKSTMPTFIILNLFGIGSGTIIWLAALKSITDTYYEAADIEGAGFFTKTFRITIPMCTPFIFYNVVTGVIGFLQTFGSALAIMNGGYGLDNSMLFMVSYIYQKAFTYLEIGYASALSWLLFIAIGIFSAILFKTSKWVYYGEDM